MKTINLFFSMLLLVSVSSLTNAQEDNSLKLTGELLTDERLLLKDKNDWAWNENRLTLKLDKRIAGNSKFYSEVWLRNIGLPTASQSADLYNKGIVDPYNLEIREAYVQLNDFLTKNLDVTIGRQRIVWGTADKLNPTDNLNPLDLEDILDFGRRRGSDAINLNYYLSNDFSLQGVFVPFFQPANMPVGVFATALNPTMELPQGMVLKSFSDTVLMPRYNLGVSSTAGFKFKGFAKGVDFSVSYVWGYDGLPFVTKNAFIPVDLSGGISIASELSFARTHIIGADMATSIAGIGFWAEAATFVPEKDVIMTNDLSAFYPTSPVPVTKDSLLLDKTKPYLKFVVGGDYNFSDGSYLNLQYMHGFVHERGAENLNDYFFLRYEKKFFNEKLKVAPIGGGFIVTNWNNIKDNYALVYMPEVSYKATDNAEITISTVIFDGKGDNLFANLKDYNMVMFKLKYSF
ncbi:hypothetical protein SDC9_44785 [bioreactor metagenome]|jgi:hypothetical protein|uniref:DUF1302 domain-containing protein n=1 Tax=bioreactor metagenome TaxID=1076179 RepID=A0A644W4A8_9ZZZZ|nr:hypothetical protein [Bacteroidales bacterium]NLF42555.1 hypothetical protein [Bacteroidales bacterium]